jgi:hypothetical protein
MIWVGDETKAREFTEVGAEIYSKAWPKFSSFSRFVPVYLETQVKPVSRRKRFGPYGAGHSSTAVANDSSRSETDSHRP